MPGVQDNLVKQKVAIYTRVSTHWQIDKDSLQVQRRELIAYSQMILNIQDYCVFEDAGFSAKNTDRPDYQSMMDRLRTGEFSHLLVWKIDRVSRNLLDFANMYEELKSLGVTFVSKNEQFDTSSAIGEAMLKIILVFAELERKMTAERVTAVMLSRANTGKWNGGRIPYGYSYDKETKEFSEHPEEGKIVRKIFELYERKQSTLWVSRYMNESGVKPRSSRDWSPTGVYKILTNIFYIGKYRYNATCQGGEYKKRGKDEWIVFDNHHIPLIDEELFNRIQFLLKRNRRGGVGIGKSYIRKNVHVFAGMLRCGLCGSNMSATLDRIRADGWRPSIYACTKHRRGSAECVNKFISDVTLGPFVFNYVANIIRAKDTTSSRTSIKTLQEKLLRGPVFSDVEKISDDTLNQLRSVMISKTAGMKYRPSGLLSNEQELLDKIETLQVRKRKHENALNRLRSLFLYGDEQIPEKDFIIEREKITKQIEELDKQLNNLKGDSEQDFGGDCFVEQASYYIMVKNLLSDRYVDYEKQVNKLDKSVLRNFIKSIISTITISDGRVMSIEFKNGIVHSFIYK